MHVDIKSWVPKFMANKYMAKAPQSWHAKLTDYFWNVYSKHKKSGDGGVAGAGKRGGNGGELSGLFSILTCGGWERGVYRSNIIIVYV